MNFGFSENSVLSDGTSSVSGRELLANAHALAAKLKDANLSRIGLLAENSVGWVTVDLACLLGGVCLVPIPTFFSDNQRDHVIETCALQAVAIDTAGEFSGVRVESLVGIVASARKSLSWEFGVIAGVSSKSPNSTYRLLLEYEF